MNDTSANSIDTTKTWIDSVQTSELVILDTAVADTTETVQPDIVVEDKEEISMMISMFLKVAMVLIAGILVWRLMTVFNRKNAQTKGTGYFKRNYSDKWKDK